MQCQCSFGRIRKNGKETQMSKSVKISPHKVADKRERLRVAAYCRVSTEHEEQSSSIEMQESYFEGKICSVPTWENVGVFAERGSGLDLRKRPMLLKLLKECEKGHIDLILTKSISRFGRNTLDMLRAIQKLRELDVDVYFEQENLWLHDREMQVILTTYFAFAQQESEEKSKSVHWGIRRGFESGTSGYAGFTCYGYRSDDDGQLVIDAEKAVVVRTIFEMRAEGKSLGAISDWLYQCHISSPSGRERWSRETVSKMLRNEKYVGDVMLQKTYIENLFSGRQEKNIGQRSRYLIRDHHPAIVSRELFRSVGNLSNDGN